MASFFQAQGLRIVFAMLLIPVLVTPALPQGNAGTYSPTVNNLLDRGFSALEKNRPKAARAAFLRALIETPENAEVLAYIGVTYCDEASLYNKQLLWIQGLDFLEKAVTRDPSVKSAAFLFYQASALRALGLRLHERAAWSELARRFPSSPYAASAQQMLREPKSRPEIAPLADIASLMEAENQSFAALVAFTEVAVVAQEGGAPELLNESVFGLVRLWNRTQQHDKVLLLKEKLRNLLQPRFATQVAIAEISRGRCPQAESLLSPLEGVPGFEDPLASLRVACQLVRDHQASGGNMNLNELRRPLYLELLTYTKPGQAGIDTLSSEAPISSERR